MIGILEAVHEYLGDKEGLPPFGERVANSANYLFMLWLLSCICLSFPLVLGLDVDLTVSVVSVPGFTYLLSILKG